MATITIKGFEVLIDDEDVSRVCELQWYSRVSEHNSYFIHHISDKRDGKSGKREIKILYLHRFIMNINDIELVVDHISGNTLDNRKENLRVCTKKQNSLNRKKYKNNTSGFKGVSWTKQRNRWKSSIRVNGKQKCLGLFRDKESAYKAYLAGAVLYFGEFARLEQRESLK